MKANLLEGLQRISSSLYSSSSVPARSLNDQTHKDAIAKTRLPSAYALDSISGTQDYLRYDDTSFSDSSAWSDEEHSASYTNDGDFDESDDACFFDSVAPHDSQAIYSLNPIPRANQASQTSLAFPVGFSAYPGSSLPNEGKYSDPVLPSLENLAQREVLPYPLPSVSKMPVQPRAVRPELRTFTPPLPVKQEKHIKHETNFKIVQVTEDELCNGGKGLDAEGRKQQKISRKLFRDTIGNEFYQDLLSGNFSYEEIISKYHTLYPEHAHKFTRNFCSKVRCGRILVSSKSLKQRSVKQGDPRMKRVSKISNRKMWTKMTPKLFSKIYEWEKSQTTPVKQIEIEKFFNINRSTYYRWKKRYESTNTDPSSPCLPPKEKRFLEN